MAGPESVTPEESWSGVLEDPLAAEHVTQPEKSYQKSANTHTKAGVASRAAAKAEKKKSEEAVFFLFFFHFLLCAALITDMQAPTRVSCSAVRRGAGTASSIRSSRLACSSSSSLRSSNARLRRKETSPTARCTSGLGSGATCERRGEDLGRSSPCGSGSDRRPGPLPVLVAVVLPREAPFAVSTSPDEWCVPGPWRSTAAHA